MRESIIPLIHQYAPPRLIPVIEQNIKESLLLRTSPISEDAIALGKTRIGGRPDLPDHIDWPTWKGRPLSFIAQINLADLPKYDFLSVLPPDGFLSFFYSAEQERWDYPNDKESWRVIHFADKDLQRRTYPSDILDQGKYKSLAVEFQRSITVPGWESCYLNLGYGESGWEEIDQYLNFCRQVDAILNEGRIINRLLGHPDEMQGEMQTDCQLASHGINYCNPVHGGVSEVEINKLKEGATDWELLLQIDSDDNAGMMWGDVGKLYFWIHRDELRRRNLDAAWMVLQCG